MLSVCQTIEAVCGTTSYMHALKFTTRIWFTTHTSIVCHLSNCLFPYLIHLLSIFPVSILMIILLFATYHSIHPCMTFSITVMHSCRTLSMNSTEVENPRRKLMCLVLFLPVQKSAHVFQKLSYSLCGLCLPLFITNNSSSDSKAFLCYIAFSGSPTAVHHAFLFFKSMWRHGYSHKLTSSRALQYYTVDMPFSDA